MHKTTPDLTDEDELESSRDSRPSTRAWPNATVPQVGTRKHVESMAYACPRATVVENHDLGYESPPADPYSPAIGHVLDSLLEPGCCQPALVAVPAGERHRRRQDQGAVRH